MFTFHKKSGKIQKMKLSFKKYGDSGPVLVLLHGFLGSRDLWYPVAKELAFDYQVYAVDQRNHGRSPHSAQLTYEAMAADLLEFLDEQRLDVANLLGHSMGGKTAMFLATSHPSRVKKMIVVDMGVKAYPPDQKDVLQTLARLPVRQMASRRQADEYLASVIQDSALRQLLLKNLVRRKESGFAWRINLSALVTNYPNLLIALPENARFNGPTLFIRGERSHYIRPDDWQGIRKHFPKAALCTFVGVGHWVHAEAPEEFIRVVRQFLKSRPGFSPFPEIGSSCTQPVP